MTYDPRNKLAVRKYKVTAKGKERCKVARDKYRASLYGRCMDALRASRLAAKRLGYLPCNATWKELAVELILQEYRCAISGIPETETKRLVMDHCHKTGKFRGWITKQHNAGVAVFENYGSEYAAYLKENR